MKSVPAVNVTPLAFSFTTHSIPYDAVVFTTEDVYSNYTLRKLKRFRSMVDLLSSSFNVHFILFSSNRDIKQQFNTSHCMVVSDYARNPYGIPIINSMFSIAHRLVNAKYYGYVNSDILLQPSLFRVLSFLDSRVRSGILYATHELAGRVIEVEYESFPPSFANLTEYEDFFHAIKLSHALRGVYSAVGPS